MREPTPALATRALPSNAQRHPPRRLPPIVMMLGIGGPILAIPTMIGTGFARPLDAMVAACMVMGAVMVASTKPRHLPLIYFAIMVSNRLVRRLLDYSAQEFSATPPTSLVLPALGIAMGAAALSDWKAMPKRLRKGSRFFVAALGYGAVVGLAWGPSMVFELISWIAPFGFGLYTAWLRPSQQDLYRWIAGLGIVSAVAMAYGWVQWLILPPWDEFWIRNAGMATVGLPRPLHCRLFGPFADPGAAGSIGAIATALLLTTPCMASLPRYGAAGICGLTTLITGVRSASLSGAAIVLTWLALKRGGGVKAMVPLALFLAVAAVALPSLPGSGFAVQRLNTLGDIGSDRSFNGRVIFSIWALKEAIGKPQGFGLGSTGLGASRLSTGDLTAFDSGYLQPLYALGIPGTILLVVSLVKLVGLPLKVRHWVGTSSSNRASVTRAVIIGFAVIGLVANPLKTDVACLFWMLVLSAHTAPRPGAADPAGWNQTGFAARNP